jgi:hypothetical protein
LTDIGSQLAHQVPAITICATVSDNLTFQLDACRSKSSQPQKVQLVEEKRAHNVAIALQGMRLRGGGLEVADICDKLQSMCLDSIIASDLSFVLQFLPSKDEVKAIKAFLARVHPKHLGVQVPLYNACSSICLTAV